MRVGREALAVLVIMCWLAAGATVAGADPVGEPTVVARGLSQPWDVVLVPDGRTWVTEKACTIREVGANGSLRTIYSDPAAGSGCLFLGLSLSPSFATNHFVYLFETYGLATGKVGDAIGRVVRLVDDGTNLGSATTIFDGIPTDLNHAGGRIRFGPDGFLYVTTGDAHIPAAAQDLGSLAGKILRLTARGDGSDGTAPPENPFASQGGAARFVWSYGHRNGLGLAWDDQGRMWESENGPSSGSYVPADGVCCRDEINLIEKGGNYGWPVITGSQTHDGMRTPAVSSGDTTTWAPGGLAFAPDGRLYMPALFGRHLRQFGLDCSGLGAQASFYGDATSPPRLRAVTAGRGSLWYTTDAERNSSGAPDDRLMRVALSDEGHVPAQCSPTPPAPTPAPPAAGGSISPGTAVPPGPKPVTVTVTLHLFRKSTGLRLLGPKGRAARPRGRYGRPKAGDRLISTDLDYSGNHTRHAAQPSASDRLTCTFINAKGLARCHEVITIGKSRLLADATVRLPPDATIPISGGTGMYAHAHGTTTSVPVGRSNDSDFTATFTT